MKSNSLTFKFIFSPHYATHNTTVMTRLKKVVGSIENIEKIFDVEFAAGMENGIPYYISSGDPSLVAKFDGKVDLTIIPKDNNTGNQFSTNKLTFKIEYLNDDVRTYINSKFRRGFNRFWSKESLCFS